MTGEKHLQTLLKTMEPELHPGEYVFCTIPDPATVAVSDILLLFKEMEGYTIIIKKDLADKLQLSYTFVASWITLKVHSSLEAVGLTAAFATALSAAGISCNVVAAFYHDHIFVDKQQAENAMEVLGQLDS